MVTQNVNNGALLKSRYIQYLPALYRDDEFMTQFLLIFESVMRPLENSVNNLELFLDPKMTPFGNPAAILEWNGQNYTPTLEHFNVSGSRFLSQFTGLELNGSASISHKWFFNFSNLTNGYLLTNSQSQLQQSIIVDECNATNNFTIFNMSYFDENDNSFNSIDKNIYY